MVRLKEEMDIVSRNAAAAFQFLMVRLKAKNLDMKNDNMIFQFLMVRLKVYELKRKHQ